MRIALAGFSLTTSMRMVNRGHRHPAHMRPLALPSDSPGLAYGDVFVVEIADLTNGGHTGAENAPHLPGLQTHLDECAFPPHHLRRCAGAPDELPALARLQLEIMDSGTERDLR